MGDQPSRRKPVPEMQKWPGYAKMEIEIKGRKCGN
jgi:hypothetical protein